MHALHLPAWSMVPFVLVLVGIAVLPLAAGHFWHSNRNKAIVMTVLAAPVAVYLLWLSDQTEGQSVQALRHGITEYASFIILLAALYTVSGGIALRGDIQARPLTNTAFLALGAVLANIIGTTGASMLLIRPVLQINQERRVTRHIPVFFIFTVANLGGLLTPLGDPPLFLGFLNGVDFFWTLSLWPHWLFANGLVLCIFFIWDIWAYRHETPQAIAEDIAHIEPLRVRGLINLLFLAGILVAVVLQSPQASDACQAFFMRFFACPSLHITRPWGEVLLLLMAFGSWWLTLRQLHEDNSFGWEAIVEVAVLFAGIFVTMVPALAWVSEHGPELGITRPWQYFWLTGGLSSFLDNAPTYLTFATLAAGSHDLDSLALNEPLVLQAISCGAVFMGANTYIGNGPNFMVKAIADQAGFKTPSFFGYMLYSGLILLPIFVVVTLVFFRS